LLSTSGKINAKISDLDKVMLVVLKQLISLVAYKWFDFHENIMRFIH